MRVSTLILTGFFCIMMAGCSVLLVPANEHSNSATAKPVNTVIDELLTYGRHYDSLSKTKQRQECKRLGQTLVDDNSSINRLRMVLALNLTPECTESPTTTELLKTTIDNEGAWFADYQMALLKRIQQQQKQLRTLKGNLKSANRRQHELEKKIEALKSIEKSINERKRNHESDQK